MRSSGDYRSACTSCKPTMAPSSSRTSIGISTSSISVTYIRPRTPHLNGKVERSHRVDDQEFYQLLDRDGITDDIHLFNAKLKEWEDYYTTTDRTEPWTVTPMHERLGQNERECHPPCENHIPSPPVVPVAAARPTSEALPRSDAPPTVPSAASARSD